jgi:hypothetical protein
MIKIAPFFECQNSCGETFCKLLLLITIVLDDNFIPDRGPHAVNADVMIDNMKSYEIQVISPAVVGDSHNSIGKAKKKTWITA